jgi:acylphosphatase
MGDASDPVCVRFLVTGRVQGVFFRASTAEQAARLGVRGHALNLPDGRVEVLALGPRGVVDELHRWLHGGPPAARVDRVDALPEEPAVHAGLAGFRTR